MTATTQFAPGHVGLNVRDLQRARDFYAAVFGFEVVREDEEHGYAFLGDGSALRLTLWRQAEAPFAKDAAGLHHLSFQVEDIAQVEAVSARLEELGARVYHGGIVPHGENVSSGGVFFEDPDGTRLEVFAPQGADAHGDAPAGEKPTCGFF